MRRFWLFFKKALANLADSPMENLFTVGVITVSITILGVYLLLLLNTSAAMNKWRGDLAVIVYLDKDISKAQQEFLTEKIRHQPEVERVRFVSSQTAQEAFLQDVPGYAELFRTLESNPLPASMELRLRPYNRNLESVDRLIAALGDQEGIQEIYFGRQWIHRFGKLIKVTFIIGGLIGLFLITSAIFIIYNTIKMSIMARRSEIEIQQLVGASNRYIYAPFMIEGMLQGLLGSLIAVILLGLGFSSTIGVMGQETSVLLGAVRWHFLSGWLVALLIFGGIVIGVAGSALSISRLSRT